MIENPKILDLELWLDKDIILRQNRLKAVFWEVLSEVGNAVDSTTLSQIHAPSRGIKLTKGNDLLGFPYQVLDLIRDFDPSTGLNIRILNWFGHGLFLFILLGRQHQKSPFLKLSEHNWSLDQSSSPWDYPEILLNDASVISPSDELLEKSSFYQWHKSISISKGTVSVESTILDELKKLIFLLS